MGSKAPAFIGDVKTFSIVRNRGSEASMLCNAQGHPVPVTRYTMTHYHRRFYTIIYFTICFLNIIISSIIVRSV